MICRLLVLKQGVDRIGHIRVQVLCPDDGIDLPVLQERVAEDAGVGGREEHVNVRAGTGIKDLGVVDRAWEDDRKVPGLHVVQVLVETELEGALRDVEALDKVVNLGRKVDRLPLIDLEVVLKGFVQRAHWVPPDVKAKMSANGETAAGSRIGTL